MALTEVYVDPSIAANSGTGTSGDPYGDLQYAVDSMTLGANGSRINVKAGTAEVITKALDFTTGFTGTISATAPLVIQGYTSTAGDGGEAELNCTTNSVVFMNDTNTTMSPITLMDCYIHSDVANLILVNQTVNVYRCRLVGVDKIFDVNAGVQAGNYYEASDSGAASIYMVYCSNTTDFQILGCYTVVGGSIRWATTGKNITAMFNILDSSASLESYTGIRAEQLGACIMHNTVKGKASGSSNEIMQSIYEANLIANNYVEGSSGNAFNAGSDQPFVGVGNAAYNNSVDFTANYTDNDGGVYLSDNTVCTASGVTNFATDNYIPTGETIDAGFPQAFFGLTGFDSMPDAGAVQSQPPAEADASSQSSVTSLSSLSSSSQSSSLSSSSTSSQTLSTSSSSSSGNNRLYRMNVFLFIPTQQ